MLRTKKTFVEEFEDVSLSVSEALTLALWQLNSIDNDPDLAAIADEAQALVAEMTFSLTNDAEAGTSRMDVFSEVVSEGSVVAQNLAFSFDWRVADGTLRCTFSQEGTDNAIDQKYLAVADVTRILGSFDKGNA